MKELKDIFKDLDTLDTHLMNVKDKLFWHQYKEAAVFAQLIYQEAGHIAASLELLAKAEGR